MPNGRDLNMQVMGETGADIQMTVETGGDAAAVRAEKWANGTANGVPVPASANPNVPTSENNAKYWANQAKSAASDSTKYPKVQGGTWWYWDAVTQQYVDSGYYASFHIVKSYASISAMNADFSGTDVKTGEMVMVVNTVEDPDNAKIYIKEPTEWHFLVDLSGATGIQGPIGVTPQFSIGAVTGLSHGASPTASVDNTDPTHPVLNLGIPAGASGNETIDDTAGLGDTDLVYSADKVVKLFRSEHEDLTSGNAEQVIGKVASTEKGAYLYRRGMHLGNRCREKVVGGTVAWNQLANIAGSSRTKTENNVTYTDNRDGSYTVSTTEQGASSAVTISITPTVKIQGHKVLFFGIPDSAPNDLKFMCGWAGTRLRKSGIYSVTNAREAFSIIVENGTVISTAVKVVPQFFDLTQMFGSTVADALYAMGDAGVQWFRNLFPKDYYAYDAGSLQSVQAASKVIKDANNNTIHTYPFDTSLTLRGIPKLDSNNRLYYDGDEYESSGKVTRKYGIVDLGTLDWTDQSTGGQYSYYSNVLNDAKRVADNHNKANLICAIYENSQTYDFASNGDKRIGISTTGRINANNNSYTTASAFKTAMSGVYLVYELATPTTESADPFTPIMQFDPSGTEEFTEWGTRDVAIPVGHITEYLTDPAKILNNIPLIEVEKESASVVTFSDGAEGLPLKELTVKVEPVQDLHGYDNPWPAGGGKNLCPIDTFDAIPVSAWVNLSNVTANSYANGTKVHLTAGTYYISVTEATNTNVLQVFNGEGNTIVNGGSASFVLSQEQDIYIRAKTSDSTVKMSFKIQIEVGSTATSWTPYSNICPISGWTGAKVMRTGKNICPGLNTSHTSDNLSLALQADGTFLMNHGNTSSWHTIDLGEVYLKAGDYRLIKVDRSDSVSTSILRISQNDTSIGELRWNEAGTVTVPKDGNYVIKYAVAQQAVNVTTKLGIFLDTTLTASEWVKSEGFNEYSVTFPTSAGTVYGGTLTVNKDGSGELVVDRLCATYNGSETWEWNAGGSYAKTSAPGAIITDAETQYNVYTKNNLFTDTSWVSRGNSVGLVYGQTNIFVKHTMFSSANDVKTFLASNNMQVVYTLATPIVYDLSPVEVTTLLGINNVWADTGNVSLTYRADTRKYIDAKFAELSAAITALGT